MYKLLLFAFMLLAITSLKAQESDSYQNFTTQQVSKAKKIASEKISNDVNFNKGIVYEDMFFWFVTTKDDKTYYFNSSKTFTDVQYSEDSYSSLMEYVIEESGF